MTMRGGVLHPISGSQRKRLALPTPGSASALSAGPLLAKKGAPYAMLSSPGSAPPRPLLETAAGGAVWGCG